MQKKEVQQAVYSARGFYLITFSLFYFTCFWYPNDLKSSFQNLSILFLTVYFSLHGLSIYLFLTAGQNPGFVNDTETPQSIKIKSRMFIGHDEDDNEKQGAIEMKDLKSTNTVKYELQNDSPTNASIDTQREVDTEEATVNTDTNTVKSIEFVAKMELPEKKFCQNCNLLMPYRSKHCKECGKCVRKFDHHCFWVGGCVGELNHRKFWAFLFFQTVQFFFAFHIALTGYEQRLEYTTNFDERNHIASIWMVFLVLTFLFILFTGGLLIYHSYLIASGQTTWEHARRQQISYLKIYPVGILPFYKGIKGNIKQTFMHGGKCTDWELRQPYELREIQGFNFCENEYYSCC